MHRIAIALAALGLSAVTLHAQAAAQSPAPKAAPAAAKIEPQFYIVGESVVLSQWPHTLDTVNAPHNITQLNPGQCIRVGVIATGDNRDDFLSRTKVSFKVTFAGHEDMHPLAPIAQSKKIKPEGGDFVTAVAAAGGIKNPLPTFASLGVPPEHWCVPNDAGDGTATIETAIESPGGHQALTPVTINIQSFDTGSKKLFTGEKEFADFFEVYYRQPNPARLVPITQFAIAMEQSDPHQALLEEVSTFLTAALKADPVAAADYLKRIALLPAPDRRLGLVALRTAGYDISSVVGKLPADEQQKINSATPPPDPFDLAPAGDLPVHLDMLWGVFGATGDYAPVKAIASGLGWRSDYDDFVKWRNTPDHAAQLPVALMRGVSYGAAGWSLASFQRSDPLAADYIEFMIAAPDISPAVKTELKSLGTNPVFKFGGAK
jgi:hypothetical protein